MLNSHKSSLMLNCPRDQRAFFWFVRNLIAKWWAKHLPEVYCRDQSNSHENLKEGEQNSQMRTSCNLICLVVQSNFNVHKSNYHFLKIAATISSYPNLSSENCSTNFGTPLDEFGTSFLIFVRGFILLGLAN